MTPTGAIDVHTHVLPVRWPDYAARHGGARWPRLEGDPASACRFFVGDAFDRTLGPEAFDPLRRIAHLDRCGIAGQVLSPPPDLFCYFADPAGALDFCRLQNDNIARLVTAHPTRFIGAGTLPLQAPALAVKELERLVTDLGIRCIEVGSNVDGRDLDDESLVEVWAAAAARDVSVFVHPVAPVLAPERLRKHRLNQAVGFPLETALAMSRVVYGGIVERWPDLRWCWAHGGGAFAYILPRVDHGWDVQSAGRAAIPRPPSEYAGRFWVDSLTLSPRVLRFALETYGEDHVVLGSDYPFKMGVDDPVRALAEVGLDGALARKIREDNARAFLGRGVG